MTEELKPNPLNKRDFLFEAVKIVEGKSPMQPQIEHLKALYFMWFRELDQKRKTQIAITNLARMAKEGKKLPTKEEIPGMLKELMEVKKDG